MDFEEWWDGIHCDLMTERQIAEAAWDAAVVNSKLTPEAYVDGYVRLPIEPVIELLKAVYGNPEVTYSMIQAAQEEE